MAQAPETQRLYLGKTMLEDAKQLAELKVENDDVLALTYQLTGTQVLMLLAYGFKMCLPYAVSSACVCVDADGSWEDVNIVEYVPDMDNTAHS